MIGRNLETRGWTSHSVVHTLTVRTSGLVSDVPTALLAGNHADDLSSATGIARVSFEVFGPKLVRRHRADAHS